MSSHYDSFMHTFIDMPFVWLWAFITWLSADPRITYRQALKEQIEYEKRRML